MSLYANSNDVKKIHAGIASILARTKEKGKHLALVRTKAFHQALGLNLPFVRFEAEVSDAVRSPNIVALYGQWGFCHWDDRYGMFVEVPIDSKNMLIEQIEKFDFDSQV